MTKPKKRPDAPRRRRTAEEARAEILDVAERRLRESGPDAIRLQEVAAELGVSHPAVLHHFGSREALVDAVLDRAVHRLEEELVSAFAAQAPGDAGGSELLDRVYKTLHDDGHARALAWLILTGRAASSEVTRANWRKIIDATHALRLQMPLVKGAAPPTREDTAFTVVLSSFAVFAEAFVGDYTLDSAGISKTARARFRPWLASVLVEHMTKDVG